MTDLRKAAEMALEALEIWENMQPNTTACAVRSPAIEALRQALAQPEQEKYVTKVVAMHEDGTYTTERTPISKREWQVLTDEEIANALLPLKNQYMASSSTKFKIGKAIEAKLKEKNT